MKWFVFVFMSVLLASTTLAEEPQRAYPVVDTGQVRCYDDRHEIAYPSPGQAWFGQDAQYQGHAPRYRDNGDGTVSDLVTGLMWQADPGGKMTYDRIVAGAKACRTGGHDDWRLPSVKELYSLIQFCGTDPDPRATDTDSQRPFIDTRYFHFRYGDPDAGDRIIDSQWATSTVYVSTVMGGQKAMFGVNFADGRIKGYPIGRTPGGRTKTYYAMYVRGNPQYGQNDFHDNGNGTVTDCATGLTWMKVDSGHLRAGPNRDGRLNWQQALAWADGLEYAGHDDWRLPTAKELQSIVDYSRSLDTTNSPAIDPVFQTSQITIEEGRTDYPFYWTSTTHTGAGTARAGVYIAFGEAPGYMTHRRTGQKQLLDVHGAGAQRSDPKTGDASRFAGGRGPQGDVVRIGNFVRCVRGGEAKPRTTGPAIEMPRETLRRSTDSDSADPAGGAPSGGPPRRGGNPRQAFIRRLDRNGDGKVSQAEFDGPARHFRDFDRNGDGLISETEAPTGPPPGPTALPRR